MRAYLLAVFRFTPIPRLRKTRVAPVSKIFDENEQNRSFLVRLIFPSDINIPKLSFTILRMVLI